MHSRNIAKLAGLAGVAVWIASSTMAQQENRALGAAFPARLLLSPASCTTPEWPPEARRYEVEGITLLNFQIGADGAVEGAKVARSSSWQLLDDTALRSLVKCRFKPGLDEAEQKVSFPIRFVWTLSGPSSIRPRLVAGSCAPSARFSTFQAFNRNASASDGVLLRFLVNGKGEPFGVKAEASGIAPELGDAAAEFLKTCRFDFDPAMPGEKTDTAFGRVLVKRK